MVDIEKIIEGIKKIDAIIPTLEKGSLERTVQENNRKALVRIAFESGNLTRLVMENLL